MSAAPIFDHEISFEPERATEILRGIPAAAGIVSLFGHSANDRPFLMQSANLRRRLQRLLQPSEGQTKRLNLRGRVARIAWTQTCSELQSLLLLYRAMTLAFGAEDARKRLRLSPPYTVRYAVENRFPRIYVTNHLRRRSLHTTFGPFASRMSAERYREAVEELFLIRRCFMELKPSPDDPGCIYGEIHKCMAPCQARCTDLQYVAEAERTLSFLKTSGAARIVELEAERNGASTEMLFEAAAAAHVQLQKAKSTNALADDLVRPLDELRLTLIVPVKTAAANEPQVHVFAFADGRMRGPETVSLLGVRLAREQDAVGSSLFAQPMMLAAVPLDGASSLASGNAPPSHSSGTAEERMLAAIARLEDAAPAADTIELGAHLALLRRWYYRPEKQRGGAVFFREQDAWPIRRMVRAAAKLVLAQYADKPSPQAATEQTA